MRVPTLHQKTRRFIMKRFIIPTLVLALTLTVFTPVAFAQGRGGGNNGNGNGNGGGSGGGNACGGILVDHLASLPIENVSPEEAATMTFMREEEKLARDVYATLALTWDIPAFSNIARAEQRHMDLVALLLQRNGVPDPVADDTVGVFTNSELQALFFSLVNSGESSLEQALLVGATIEDLDIADLQEMLAESDNLDINLVAYNLAKGSRNHLRAFSRTLEKNGFDPYAAQYLDQDEVDAIIASDQERGVIYDEYGDELTTCEAGKGSGKGRGNGRGNGQGGGRGPGTGTCRATN
jgi:hypothetical protein